VLLVLNDVTVVVAVAVALTAASGYFAREAERALVIELGPTRHPGLPLTTRLSRALADRELQVRYLVPDLGWVDERGRDVSPPPDTHHITRAVAPGGGEVALVHSGRAGSDTRLAHAAASAAALSLEAARLDAEVRSRAREVEQSRRRLLSAVDEERRMLEERLRDLVLMRLGGVDRMLAGHGELERERRELRVAVDELVALGRGLYPPTLARTDLERGLRETGRRLRLPLRVTVTGDASAVPDAYRAAAWFVCSEALTNVARHASATSVAVRLDVSERELSVEVEDDGRGGATLERGLRGLADRVEALGGRFTLSSPPGGPTRIRAVLVL
jgi:signal transduction histidine kinase